MSKHNIAMADALMAIFGYRRVMGKKSRNKGAGGEREVVTYLRERGLTADRTGAQAGNGTKQVKQPDVMLDWWRQEPNPQTNCAIEVKRLASLPASIKGWLAEAVENAGDALPMVMAREDRGEWLVIMRADDLFGGRNGTVS